MLVKSQPLQEVVLLSDLASRLRLRVSEPRARERPGQAVGYLLSIDSSILLARGSPVPVRTLMGELVFVGLGLGNKGVSLDGVEKIRASEFAYFEEYTSPPSHDLLEALEQLTGKKLALVSREFVEDGKRILEQAVAARVVLAVQGDPMIATTHNDLRCRAISRGIPTSVVHGTTVAAAAASESGLHYYKFAGAITFTRESVSHYQEVYRRVHTNLLAGQHTLILLEYDTDAKRGVEPGFVFEKLLEAERNFKRLVVTEETFVLVLSRLGMPGQDMRGGAMGSLRAADFGASPHCIIVPGKLHFTEEEALAALLPPDERKAIADNTKQVRRAAQVLVPRYVEKANKALSEARLALNGRHPELLENAELYLRDSESFLANEEDELAMLSIGYAEGLIDALSFTGEVKLSW
jgi:diphthine synthase